MKINIIIDSDNFVVYSYTTEKNIKLRIQRSFNSFLYTNIYIAFLLGAGTSHHRLLINNVSYS